jgi:hypothetical protein
MGARRLPVRMENLQAAIKPRTLRLKLPFDFLPTMTLLLIQSGQLAQGRHDPLARPAHSPMM